MTDPASTAPSPFTCTEFGMIEVDGENAGSFPTQHPDRPVLMSEAATMAWLRAGLPTRFTWRDRDGASILYLAGEDER